MGGFLRFEFVRGLSQASIPLEIIALSIATIHLLLPCQQMPGARHARPAHYRACPTKQHPATPLHDLPASSKEYILRGSFPCSHQPDSKVWAGGRAGWGSSQAPIMVVSNEEPPPPPIRTPPDLLANSRYLQIRTPRPQRQCDHGHTYVIIGQIENWASPQRKPRERPPWQISGTRVYLPRGGYHSIPSHLSAGPRWQSD